MCDVEREKREQGEGEGEDGKGDEWVGCPYSLAWREIRGQVHLKKNSLYMLRKRPKRDVIPVLLLSRL